MNRREFLWKLPAAVAAFFGVKALAKEPDIDEVLLNGYKDASPTYFQIEDRAYRKYTLPNDHPGVLKDHFLEIDGLTLGVAERDLVAGETGWVQVFGPCDVLVL